MRRTFRILLTSLLVLVLLAAGVFIFLPWKEYAAPAIARQLRAQGLPVESFAIDRLGRDGVTIAPLALATEPPITLPQVTLGWNFHGFAKPELKTLTIKGLRYDLSPGATAKKEEATSIPVDPALFKQIPLEKIDIEDAELFAVSKEYNFSFPFSGSLTLAPAPVLSLKAETAQGASGKKKFEVKKLRLKLMLNAEKKRWEGTLAAASVTELGDTPTLPPLTPEIALTLGEQSISAKAKAGEYRADAKYDVKNGSVKISHLDLPFAGGSIEAAPFTYAEGAPLEAKFTLNGIDLETAMKLLMEESGVSATGTLDGTIPIRLKDGVLSFGEGALKARDKGRLALSGDSLGALSGAGGQAGNVALLLGDFQFSLLKLDFDPAPNDEVVVRLKLEGNNPNVYDGKRVHLNVTLQGDVMKSLKSSLELLEAPQEWIEKEMKDTQ